MVLKHSGQEAGEKLARCGELPPKILIEFLAPKRSILANVLQRVRAVFDEGCER